MISCDVAILKWFKRYITTIDITPRKPADQVTKRRIERRRLKLMMLSGRETAPQSKQAPSCPNLII